MNFKKRLISLFLAIALTVGILPLMAATGSADGLKAEIFICDSFVYAGGLYDITVLSSDPNSTYQWIVYYDYDRYVEIDDNDYYHGTHTDHLSVSVNDGHAYGSGWEALSFGCKVSSGGQTVLTSTRTMHVYTQQTLLEDLEKDGVSITRFGIGNATLLSEEGSVQYYEMNAGDTFSVDCGYDALDARYSESEIKLVKEISVTENGRLTKFDNVSPPEYTTYKIGDGAVVVHCALAVYINGVRFTTVDSKTAVINTVTPDFESEAEAKYDCSVLWARYAEAQRLASLQKGASVYIISNEGAWCRVAAGGAVGYIPSSELNFYDTVGVIEVFAQEPEHLSEANFDVTFGSDRYVLWDGPDAVTWYDETEGRYLSPGDQFYNTRTYTLTVWIEAADGALFRTFPEGKANVKGTLNGEDTAVDTAYGQVYNEVVEISRTYSHVHDLNKCPRVYPTCTEDGRQLYYYCDCGAKFADYRAEEKIYDENWGVIPAVGHRESEYRSNGLTHYKVCLRRECGEILEEYRGTHTGGEANCSQRAICAVCGLPYGEYGGHVYTGGSSKCVICGSTDPYVTVFSDVAPVAFYYDAVMWAVGREITAGTSKTTFSPNAGCTRAQVVTFLWRAAGKPAPSTDVCPFSDVEDEAYYYKPVLWAVEQGITNGTDATHFSPSKTCTRGQIVTFLWRANGSPAASAINPFSDVKRSDYFYDAVLWAVGKGITNGTDATHFSPSKTCTRGEVVTFMWRAEGKS